MAALSQSPKSWLNKPRQTNPFKRLFLTADLCALARVVLALSIMLYFGNLYHALLAFILCSLLTDSFLLRPRFKKTFTTRSFREEHVTWLKEKQDINQDDLRVFFRKIMSYRALACSLTLMSIPAIWLLADETWALRAAPFVYVVAMFFILHRLSQKPELLPKKFRSSSWNGPLYESSRLIIPDYQWDEIRHWDVTDPRGMAYRSYHAHHDYLRQIALDNSTYTLHKWYE